MFLMRSCIDCFKSAGKELTALILQACWFREVMKLWKTLGSFHFVESTPLFCCSPRTTMSAFPLCPTDILSDDAHSPLMWKTECMNVGQRHRLYSTRLLAGTDCKCCSCFPRLLPGIPCEICGGMNYQIRCMDKTFTLQHVFEDSATSLSKQDLLARFCLTETSVPCWDSLIWWDMQRGKMPLSCHVGHFDIAVLLNVASPCPFWIWSLYIKKQISYCVVCSLLCL